MYYLLTNILNIYYIVYDCLFISTCTKKYKTYVNDLKKLKNIYNMCRRIKSNHLKN